MNAWWVGTVSTIIGATVGAVLQAWRERTLHQRQMSVRWDQTLINGLTDYLATADRAMRALLRWRHVRAEGGDSAAAVVTAEDAYESLHEKSHLIALLTGGRDDPIRASARAMRQALLPLCEEMRGRGEVSEEDLRHWVTSHHRARAVLLRETQMRFNRTD